MSREFHPLLSRFQEAEFMAPEEFENEIPVVDLENYHPGDEQLRGVVVDAFRDIGFLFVRTPDIIPKLDGVYGVYKDLFHLPQEVLDSYAHPEIHFQRGYTPGRQEAGIFCQKIGPKSLVLPDDKRGWFTGPDLPEGHPLVMQYPHFYPQNIWPREVPEFEGVVAELREDLFKVGRQVMAVLEDYFGYSPGFYDDVIQDSPTLLRSIHYPEVTQESYENSVWACEHTDINLITVLPRATSSGLWVQTKTGEWIKGKAPGNCSLVQVGDMLEYMTGGEFLSAHHMVLAPDGVGTPERYSSALFVHPRSDWLFQVWDENGQSISGYPDILAADLLMKRLKEIGLAE